MNRRNFLSMLASLPLLGWLRPKGCQTFTNISTGGEPFFVGNQIPDPWIDSPRSQALSSVYWNTRCRKGPEPVIVTGNAPAYAHPIEMYVGPSGSLMQVCVHTKPGTPGPVSLTINKDHKGEVLAYANGKPLKVIRS